MKARPYLKLTLLACICLARAAFGQDSAILPAGVRAVWNLEHAWRETTPTRERVCLNGLWRWQPANEATDSVPAENWGYLKVPGCWPGITDYEQKDCQTLYPHPAWKSTRLGGVTTAWYQREFTVPANWTGRRIYLSVEYLNSFATVFVDGKKAGEVRFPGGDVDLSQVCRPGATHLLSLAVVALPLKGVMLSYSDTFGAKQVQGTVARRGLCGDVYLASAPIGPRITGTQVRTSVREWQITTSAALQDLKPDAHYVLRARITDHGRVVKEFTSQPFTHGEVKDGHYSFSTAWKPEKLWDTITPDNQYELGLSLLAGKDQVLDTALPERFGFREFWIQGRDFYLNGTRIFLCAVPLDNAQLGAAWATYAGTRESLQRLKSFGVNFVYTHNYGCEPGANLSFAEMLRAADDEGILVSFSQPHFSQYDWKSVDADQNNGYARHAEFFVKAAGNHPSVVCYSMSHNATGTEEQMNPDQIDGVHDARNRWSSNNVKQALRAEAIVERLDPGRIVYHHSSANLGSMYTANFYANFVPVQEMSDWFEHWSTAGVKPLFLCEYGAPLSWDWMMYRGWYKGTRTFGSARVPWELCIAEWNAQFFGDRAYQITDIEKAALRWEAQKFRAGELWYRWDYPRSAVDSPDIEQRNQIFATYLADNFRAFRTWGVSAYCPWDHGIYWKLRDGADRSRKEFKVDWESLQRPGLSPDYVEDQMTWMNCSYERADWVPTVAAQALYRNNLPLLAYIAGKPAAFTSKDHNFSPGETVAKQIIVINNSRRSVTADCAWSLSLPRLLSGHQKVSVETGQQSRVPISFLLPAEIKPGKYQLAATINFSNGESQSDSFTIDVLPKLAPIQITQRVALFDPKGETGKLLRDLGIECTAIDAAADLAPYNLLIVGKGALNPDSPAPDISRVLDGLKVLMFEQTSETLERRFGFRVEEYGLRQVFARVADHPALAGLNEEQLHDWCGEATLLSPRLKYEIGQRHAPEVKWCGISVTRLWRASNRGNVASVLIEKPARGDFLPILDGGFSLQFSPLLEYREGKGMVLFCQMDVTGRSEPDPAADVLVRDLLRYASLWKPTPRRQAIYAGDPAGRHHLEEIGVSPGPYQAGALSANDVLIVGPGGGKQLAPDSAAVAQFAKSSGGILALGLNAQDANAFLPGKVEMQESEHIASYFPPFAASSPFEGISSADVHNRDPRTIPLVSSGVATVGGGVLARATNANIVFCQLTPWSFASTNQMNLRRTYRHVSFLTTRLLANLGVAGSAPILERFHQPTQANDSRWLAGLYLDTPEEWDDPYRFFCW